MSQLASNFQSGSLDEYPHTMDKRAAGCAADCASAVVNNDRLVRKSEFALGLERNAFTISNRVDEGLQTSPPVATRPVIIFSAMRAREDRSTLADAANAKRRGIAPLHPGALIRWFDSVHAIPREDPESVITAIHDAVQPIRAARMH